MSRRRSTVAKSSHDAGMNVHVNVNIDGGQLQTETFSDDAESTKTETETEIAKSFVSNRFRICKSADGEEKREFVCVAMVANEIDAHGDMWTVEAVENAANDFLAQYNVSKAIGADHDGSAQDIDLIGSWYTETGGTFDGLEVPEFAWVAKCKVNEDEVWEGVKDETYTGLSVQGTCEGGNVEKQKLAKSTSSGEANETQLKRVLTKAHLTNLDLVDEGANLKFGIWKSKDNSMTQEINTNTDGANDTAVVETTMEKNKAPKGEGTAAAHNGTAETPSTPVAKSTETPADPLDAFADMLALAKKGQVSSPELEALEKAYEALGSMLKTKTQEAAPVEKAKVPEAPAPTGNDAVMLTALTALTKAVTDLGETQKSLNSRVDEIDEARGASAGASDDDGTEDIAKSKEDAEKIEKSKGVFSIDMTGAFPV